MISKHIVTITINPALDKTTEVDSLIPDKKLRCSEPKIDPGGGGINVSRAIKKLGGDSTAIYMAGGSTGQKLTELIEKEGVRQVIVTTKNDTRENIMVDDRATQNQYRFNLPGKPVSQEEYQRVLSELDVLIPKPDYIVASGSLLPGMPNDFYAKVAAKAKEMGAKLILDTSGEALKTAAGMGVYLLKPNYSELCELTGHDKANITDVKELAKEIIQKGFCEVAIVSLGSKGAMLIDKDNIYHVQAPKVPKRSTVGAGDSLVAGITLSLARGKSLFDALKFGVACGTAATMRPGTDLCNAQDVEKLLQIIG
ncbi:MAG TPA: phosphofructokinase [Cytophagales bacterium]|jgi:6-phosphofructokinase 2|nr:phosphofructokinase [Cytophagales bacterium]